MARAPRPSPWVAFGSGLPQLMAAFRASVSALPSSPQFHRWRALAATLFMLGGSVMTGVILPRLQLDSGQLLIALLGAVLAGVVVWVAVCKLENRLGVAATSEATLAALALLLLPLNAIRVSASATVGDLFLLALIVPFAARVATGRAIRVPSWLLVAGALVSMSVVAQALIGSDLGSDVVPGVLFVVAMTGTPLVLSGAARNPAYREVLIKAWLLGSALAAAVALADASGLTAIGPTLTGVVWTGRFAGLTVHPNHLGLVAVMAFPVAVWWLNSRPKWPGRLMGTALAGFLVLGVLVSGSRAALICLLAVGFLSLLTQTRNRKQGVMSPLMLLLFCALVIGAVSVFMPTVTSTGFVRLFSESSADENQARLDVMTASLFSFYGSPVIGVGFSTLKVANNLALQSLQAGGLLAALGFAVYVLGAIVRGVRSSRLSDGLGVALSLSLLAWLVDGIFENIVYDRFLFVPVGLLLALRLTGTGR